MNTKMHITQTLYIVGKITGSNPDLPLNPSWEFQGLYSSRKAAEARCKGPLWFIGPVLLNKIVPEETTNWPGIYFPLEEKVDLAGR